MRFFISMTFAGVCMFAGPISHAAECDEIRFKQGESSAVVMGEAPAEGNACLRFRAGAGQNVRLSIQSVYDQAAFSIVGLEDNQMEYAFISKKQSYDLLIHQTMRAISPVNYRLTLSID